MHNQLSLKRVAIKTKKIYFPFFSRGLRCGYVAREDGLAVPRTTDTGSPVLAPDRQSQHWLPSPEQGSRGRGH